MAPRSSPQLRLFRNDFAAGHAALALRLIGTKSNRDAVGARVTIETDQGRATRIVKAGSGFLSQHSKELLFGLGKSQRIVKVDDRVAQRPRADRLRTCPSIIASGSRKVVTRSAASRSGPPAFPRRLHRHPPPQPMTHSPAAPGSTSPFRRPTSRFATSMARSIRSRRSAGTACARLLLGDVGPTFAHRARGVVAPARRAGGGGRLDLCPGRRPAGGRGEGQGRSPGPGDARDGRGLTRSPARTTSFTAISSTGARICACRPRSW